jgi:type III restriction enzyme
MQRELERLAREEEKETGEYLRPIVLFQAQAHSQQRETLTPDVLKKALVDDFRVLPNQIAIATGDKREIDGVDLKERTQPIRFIITVQALKEGWDCPFAYILCALAETGSARAVEQILGRILRLPGATKKRHNELDCAYAFVTSDQFAAAAKQLKDALVADGFEKMEAEELVGTFEEPHLPLTPGGLFAPRGEVVSQAPDLAKLPESLRSVIQYDPQEGTISIPGAASETDVKALQSAFVRPEDKEAIRRIVEQKKARVTPRLEVQARPPFVIPGLALRTGSVAHLFNEEPLLEIAFDLNKCSTEIPENIFPPANQIHEGNEAVIDVTDEGRLDVQFKDELHAQLQKLWNEPDWTIAALAGWLDRHVRHLDIGQSQFALFAHGVVTYLTEKKGWEIGALGRQKFRLAAALEEFVAWHRDMHRNLAYQQFLFGAEKTRLEVSPEVVFTLTEEEYAPHEFFRGATFARHAFSCVGDMNELELECARLLDSHRLVKRWVRNIDRRETSFWLQTPSDKFYPDFLAELTDGRYLVVECKGEDRWSNDDSKEKRAIGDLWAERSKGKCLFVMPKGDSWADIVQLLSV